MLAYAYTRDPKTPYNKLIFYLHPSPKPSPNPNPKVILTRYNNPIFASEQRYIDSVRSSRRDSSPASDQTSQSASESRLTATNRA